MPHRAPRPYNVPTVPAPLVPKNASPAPDPAVGPLLPDSDVRAGGMTKVGTVYNHPMTITELFPNVHHIPLGYVNSFLITGDEGLTLVDSGLKGNSRAILKAVADIDRKPEDIRHILATHHHSDHVGSLAALKAKTGAVAYAHSLDAPIVAGEKPRPGPNAGSIVGRIAGPAIVRLPQNNPPPAPIEHEINDGDDLPIAGGLRVIHTPGHTAGSVAFLLRQHGGVLFAGDAAAHMFGRLGKPMLLFTEDMDAAKDSIRKLAGVEFDTACFGHGTVVQGGALSTFKRYVEKLAR